MWKKYFKFIKLKPGRVVTHQFGELDFRSDKIPVETVKALYESDFPYLEITEEGKVELYGMPPVEKIAEPVILPPDELPSEETTQSEQEETQAEEPVKSIRKATRSRNL